MGRPVRSVYICAVSSIYRATHAVEALSELLSLDQGQAQVSLQDACTAGAPLKKSTILAGSHVFSREIQVILGKGRLTLAHCALLGGRHLCTFTVARAEAHDPVVWDNSLSSLRGVLFSLTVGIGEELGSSTSQGNFQYLYLGHFRRIGLQHGHLQLRLIWWLSPDLG